MSKEKYIYVVLSKSPTIISQTINKLKGDSYTHAALSLDKELSYMFSFGRRQAWNPFVGCFKREGINDGLYKSLNVLPGVVIEIPVTSKQYDDICGLIEKFLLDAHVYGYNYIGLASNLLGKVYPNNTRFFCSEFVYYVLNESGVCDLGIPRGLVRPQTLLGLKGRVVFEGNLKTYGGRLSASRSRHHIFPFMRFFSQV